MGVLIRPRQRKETAIVRRNFIYRDDPNAGFAFDTDERGNPVFGTKEAEKSYRYCLAHPELFKDLGNETEIHTFFEDALVRCECGKEITVAPRYYGADECPFCGRWHNLFGDQLLPPDEWQD